ncbi:MAG: hypothetical protein L7S72_03735 [Flavobacteriales bacterium]|nr:hypothetical protein [Flavobacteriales bacterium]
MATTKCLDCKKEVSKSADTCPHCGANVPNIISAISALIAFGFAAYVLSIFFL